MQQAGLNKKILDDVPRLPFFPFITFFFWTLSSRIACQIVHVVCSFCFATICFALAHRSTFNVHCSLFTFPFPFKHLNLKLWRFSGQALAAIYQSYGRGSGSGANVWTRHEPLE